MSMKGMSYYVILIPNFKRFNLTLTRVAGRLQRGSRFGVETSSRDEQPPQDLRRRPRIRPLLPWPSLIE
jgi:hypothetical protein